jgi:hypothetical protein
MMLSFDVSVIDIAMMIAIAVLFALFLGGQRGENQKKEKTFGAQIVQSRREEAITNREQPNQEESNCPHSFGYLRTLRRKNVPEECLGCSKLAECLFSD